MSAKNKQELIELATKEFAKLETMIAGIDAQTAGIADADGIRNEPPENQGWEIEGRHAAENTDRLFNHTAIDVGGNAFQCFSLDQGWNAAGRLQNLDHP